MCSTHDYIKWYLYVICSNTMILKWYLYVICSNNDSKVDSVSNMWQHIDSKVVYVSTYVAYTTLDSLSGICK